MTNQSADRLTKRNVSDMYPDHKTEHLRLFRNTQVYKRNMIAYQNVQLLFLCFRYGSHAYWFARWLVGWSFGRMTLIRIFKFLIMSYVMVYVQIMMMWKQYFSLRQAQPYCSHLATF